MQEQKGTTPQMSRSDKWSFQEDQPNLHHNYQTSEQTMLVKSDRTKNKPSATSN